MSYDSDVVSATSGRGEPDWDKIIKLCNRIRDSIGTLSMAQAMGSVMRRVKHTDSNIQLHALTLLESCVSNCGQDFQSELTKSTFHADVKNILTGPYTDPRVKQRLKELLASWSVEFKNNSKMAPYLKYVDQLHREGVLSQSSPAPVRQQQQQPVASAPASQEDADLKKAIQLSLLDSKSTPPTSNLSLYPSVGATSAPAQRQPQKKAGKKVRAVYDFVAAEDNELSFRAGEIITLLDDSDENWWRGETQLGKGLFPASFVSANLSVEPQPSNVEKESKSSSGAQVKKSKKTETKKVVVNEQKIDLLLEMIKGADVTSEENKAEYETILELEDECKKMKSLVDESVASLQSEEDDMQEINKKFEDALVLYRKLLSEGPRLSSSVAAQKQPSPVAPPTHPTLSEPSPYTAQSALPVQTQLHTITPPQAQLHTITPPQAQPHAIMPHQAQPHSITPPQAQSHTITPPQAQSHTITPPQAQSHTITPPQAQPHTITPPQAYTTLPPQHFATATLPPPDSTQQPPPYTASSLAPSGGVHSAQSGYDPTLQPNSLSFGGSMLGVGQQPSMSQAPFSLGAKPVTYPQQSYYSHQDPARMKTASSPVSLPTSYQPTFYPQQQQTHLVQQPLL